MEHIVIGPCKCGGYGQVYDEATEKEMGRCHSDLNQREKQPPPNDQWCVGCNPDNCQGGCDIDEDMNNPDVGEIL